MRAARRLDRGRGRAAGRRVADGNHPAFLARVDDEYPNVREAIAFARKAHDGELLLRLATSLWGFWSSRVYGAEGRRALEEALELSGRRSARTLLGLCTLRMLSGSGEQLSELAEEALRPARSWATTTASRRPGTSSAESQEP